MKLYVNYLILVKKLLLLLKFLRCRQQLDLLNFKEKMQLLRLKHILIWYSMNKMEWNSMFMNVIKKLKVLFLILDGKDPSGYIVN